MELKQKKGSLVAFYFIFILFYFFSHNFNDIKISKYVHQILYQNDLH